ncbi:uncharacterized protein DDB_G0286447-like [Musca vetustissima]|uniref:uncharacterized protein DDB_G0286447-like n=1 Tax=Musca vetustissima TaxID=27455 RepID=UPI002AB63A77|nr:uncharacterized protein DDB_G0286447-like [Musca vetustissima]
MNALKVQNPNMPQMKPISISPLQPQQTPLAIQTANTAPAVMGNFAAFGAPAAAAGIISPGLASAPVIGGPVFFNNTTTATTSPNIPSSQPFANFNQMNNLMQPTTQKMGFISNNNNNVTNNNITSNSNNNNNIQSFDFFQ